MLLFQFRVMINNDPGARRMCEKRLINFRSETAKAALKDAKRKCQASGGTERAKARLCAAALGKVLRVNDALRNTPRKGTLEA